MGNKVQKKIGRRDTDVGTASLVNPESSDSVLERRWVIRFNIPAK